MRRRGKIAGFFIFILILAVGGLGYYSYRLMGDKKVQEEKIDELEFERNQNSKTAWIALSDVKKGEKLEPDFNVELQQIYIGVDESSFWRPDGTNDTATADIAAGTPIFETMVTAEDFKDSEREYDIAIANLMTSQADYDYVDVRITFPDGSDYVILSKKKVSNLSLENCMFTTTLDESEIQKIQSATLDAYLTTGTHIYTTRYVEAELQDAAISNYPVKEATLLMLSKSNNVNLEETLSIATLELNRQARLNLEDRLGQITPEDLAAAQTAWTEQQAKFQAEINAMLENESY